MFPWPRAARSRRQREGLGLDLHELTAERSDPPVEVGGLGTFEIGEKAPKPRREMFFEQLLVGTGLGAEPARRKTRHDLAQDRGVILWLALSLGALDAKRGQVAAQPCER